MEKKQEAVSFIGVVSRIATTVDGGWRVSIDLPEGEAMNTLWKMKDSSVTVAIVENPEQ